MNTVSSATHLCAICGERVASTRDHVPPRGVFEKPPPVNLITVPACAECNNGSSKDDELFKAYLGLRVGDKAPAGFQRNVRRTFDKNRRLWRDVVTKLEPVTLLSATGLVVGKADRLLWDGKEHDRVIERIIRGLYFHHYKQVLGNRVSLRVQWPRDPRRLDLLSRNWPQNVLGSGDGGTRATAFV
jgi:hypothetical protein